MKEREVEERKDRGEERSCGGEVEEGRGGRKKRSAGHGVVIYVDEIRK